MTPNQARGVAIRRSLVAVLRLCHAQNVRVPTYTRLGHALGISHSQVTRHMARLLDENVFTPRGDGRRMYVDRITN